VPLTIGTNISSLQAQRELGKNTRALSKVFERLSTGLRINSPSDDVAGLTLSSSLAADIKIYSQGLRNLGDGVSLLNIADSALSEMSSIITRIQELAEQSANGVYSSTQRNALNTEAQSLIAEYQRIVETTTYNDTTLLDGSIQNVNLQIGPSRNDTIAISIGSAALATGSGTFGTFTTFAPKSDGSIWVSATVNDVNGDGKQDLVLLSNSTSAVMVLAGNGDGTFKAGVTFAGSGNGGSLIMSDFSKDGNLDIVSNTSGNGAWFYLSNGDGSFKAGVNLSANTGEVSTGSIIKAVDVNNDTNIDLVQISPSWEVTFLGNGNGTFKSSIFQSSASNPSGADVADISGDTYADIVTRYNGYFLISIGNGNGTFKAATTLTTVSTGAVRLEDVNGDGIRDLVAGNNDANGSLTIYLGNGNATFKAPVSYTSGVAYAGLQAGDLNQDGITDYLGSSGTGYQAFLANGDGTFRVGTSGTNPSGFFTGALADINSDGILDRAYSGGFSAGGYAGVTLGEGSGGISGLSGLDISTSAGAITALSTLSTAASTISSVRAGIGAHQSRIAAASENITSIIMAYQEAHSRIVNADISQDTAELVRLQILQQASAAILGQANQSIAVVRRLLG
jgi:flagellin